MSIQPGKYVSSLYKKNPNLVFEEPTCTPKTSGSLQFKKLSTPPQLNSNGYKNVDTITDIEEFHTYIQTQGLYGKFKPDMSQEAISLKSRQNDGFVEPLELRRQFQREYAKERPHRKTDVYMMKLH